MTAASAPATHPGDVVDPKLARRLVLDELFDLSLYTGLHKHAKGQLQSTLAQLMLVERKHLDFWQELFGVRAERLDLSRRIQLGFMLLVCRVLGEGADTQAKKQRFLGESDGERIEAPERPWVSGTIVGLSYVVGALVPTLPVLLGAVSLWASVIAGTLAVILVSSVLSFLSGMALRRRIGINLTLAGLSVVLTYAIGTSPKTSGASTSKRGKISLLPDIRAGALGTNCRTLRAGCTSRTR